MNEVEAAATDARDEERRLAELLGRIPDGATVMVGGFGEPGTPFHLLEALAASGVRDLTVVKNDANEPDLGIGRLLAAGCLRRLVSSHIGLNRDAVAAMNEGRLAVEFHPQGLLAEKIRCGGAGLPGFLCDLDLELLPEADAPRTVLSWEGRQVWIEGALRADVALIHAHAADPFGNLAYRAAARNFNPLMAAAADQVIAEVERRLAEPLDPDAVATPGALVDHVFVAPPGAGAGTRAARMRGRGAA